jgi:hypothetical protein
MLPKLSDNIRALLNSTIHLKEGQLSPTRSPDETMSEVTNESFKQHAIGVFIEPYLKPRV